jgi:hypothetical protein
MQSPDEPAEQPARSDATLLPLSAAADDEMRRTRLHGINQLMLAILEDAMRTYLGPPTRAQAEAALWIGETSDRGVFSFQVVCETLGLQPDAVRAAMQRRRRDLGPTPLFDRLARSRPNGRRHAGLGIAAPAGRVDHDDAA